MNDNRRLVYPLLIAFLAVPVVASANAGSPLMWATMLYMAFGNAVIGVIEGSLLSRLFRLNWQGSCLIMVAANYVSAIIGLYTIGQLSGALLNSPMIAQPLYDVPKLLPVLVPILFAATVVIEYPFCLWALSRGKQHRARLWRKALIASLAAQVLSYGLLTPYYLMAVRTNLYTEVEIDRSLSFARTSRATVHFIGPDGGVYRVNVDGSGRRKVLDTNIRSEESRLFLRKSSESDTYDLWVMGFSGHDDEKLLVEGFTNTAPAYQDTRFQRSEEENTQMNFGPALEYPRGERQWEVWTGYWEYQGLWASDLRTGESFSVALDVPYVPWEARNATILPEDIVVFQLGDQIVALDLNSRKIGLIALGRGPVVTVD